MKKSYNKVIIPLLVLILIGVTNRIYGWTYPSSTPSSPFASGGGTSRQDPYIIKTAQQLANLAYLVNTDNHTYAQYSSGKYYFYVKLGADIDLGSQAWTPIGNSSSYTFKGEFDGAGYTISGLSISKSTSSVAVGLFGYTGGSGTYAQIWNTNVKGSVTGKQYVGAVVGYAYNTGICVCANTGCTVKGTTGVGGVVGYFNGCGSYNLWAAGNAGNVTGTNDVGGIVGYNKSGQICFGAFNSGTISGTTNCGAIIGNYATTDKYYSCYYLSGSASKGIGSSDSDNCTAVTSTQCSSGSLAYTLCNDTWSGVQYCFWGQKIGTDSYPMPNSGWPSGSDLNRVYCNYTHGTTTAAYTNSTTGHSDAASTSNYKHDSSYTMTATWTGTTACSIKEVCSVCGKTVTQSATITSAVTKAATCASTGVRTYTAKVTTAGGLVYTTTTTETIAKTTSHSYSNGICSKCGAYQQPTLSNNIYQINNAGKLYWFASQVNSGSTTINGKLTGNVTVNSNVLTSAGALNGTPSRSWTPIGNSTYKYSGTFDGGDYTVSGLYVNSSTTNDIGLFGSTGSSSIIQNVKVADSYFNGEYSVGAICGDNKGKIGDCTSNATVIGASWVGGICGSCSAINSIVQYCNNSAKVSGTSMVGGICGAARGTIRNCKNSGAISGTDDIGGIAGGAYDDIDLLSRCYNDGSVTGTGNYIGGILGGSYTDKYSCNVISCMNVANVSGGSYVGGVVGSTWSSSSESSYVKSSCNLGSVSGTSNVGALVGMADSYTYISQNVYNSDKCSTVVGNSAGQKSSNTGKASFVDGEIAYRLNSPLSSDDVCWYQNIDNDLTVDTYPVLDDTSHGDVYGLPTLSYYTNTPVVKATSVSVDNSTDMEIAIGQPMTAAVTVLPADATINTDKFKAKNINAIKWTSGTSSVATIGSTTGEVSPITYGTTTLSASVLDGSGVSSSASLRVYLLGDANGNDKVNVADVQTIAAKMNGLTPTSWHFAPANATFSDNTINVGDITSTLNIVLNGISSAAKGARNVKTVQNVTLTADNIDMAEEGENRLNIGIDNPGTPFTAYEFSITLPDGIKVKKSDEGNIEAFMTTERTSADKTDYFSAREMENGDIYVLCYSTQLENFVGETGSVANITLQAEVGAKAGIYPVEIHNAVVSNCGNVITPVDIIAYVNVGNATGIESLVDGEYIKDYVYDLSGRLVKVGGKATKRLENLPAGVYIVNGQKICK